MIAYIHRVWNLVESICLFNCTWPETNMSKRRFIFRNIYWTVTFINTTWIIALLILCICHIDTGIVVMIEVTTEMLLQKVKTYIKNANEYEINVIHGYIERYKKQFLAILFQYISSAFLFCTFAALTSKALPVHTWIPFSIERDEIYYSIFFVESYTILQTALGIFSDFMIVGLIIYMSARLDVLGSEMEHVSDYDALINCIKQHQEIIGFFEDTTSTVWALLFKTNFMMGGAVISAVLCLLYAKDESYFKVCMYLSIVCSGCGHIFIITWPADDLRESSIRFARSLYNIPWAGKSPRISSAMLIMMQRCQKPFLITMGQVLPVLSLQYFSQFLSNVFSYFMAMRSMLE